VNFKTYTADDRRAQLGELAIVLGRLIPLANELGLPQATDYVAALERTKLLLATTFTQEDLSALARAVPDVLYRHKEWASENLIRKADGSVGFPDWLERIEVVLQPALSAAHKLRELG